MSKNGAPSLLSMARGSSTAKKEIKDQYIKMEGPDMEYSPFSTNSDGGGSSIYEVREDPGACCVGGGRLSGSHIILLMMVGVGGGGC
jgi:hypothetical protein